MQPIFLGSNASNHCRSRRLNAGILTTVIKRYKQFLGRPRILESLCQLLYPSLMTGSATTFQVHCSVRSARGRQYGKKYLFRLLLTKTFSCSDVRNVTRLLDAFPSERKANSKVTQNSRAAYRDASGGSPKERSQSRQLLLSHFSYRIHP